MSKKPTVGDSIWLMCVNPTAGIPVARGAPLAAIITNVHSDANIGVAFFDAIGGHHAMASVPMMQDDGQQPGGEYYAKWPDASKPAEVPAGAPSNVSEGLPTTGGMTPKDVSLSAENVTGNDQKVSGAVKSEAESLAQLGGVGQPTVGGLTPKDAKLPAPAADDAKKTAAKETAKAAVKVAAKQKAIAAKPVAKKAAKKR